MALLSKTQPWKWVDELNWGRRDIFSDTPEAYSVGMVICNHDQVKYSFTLLLIDSFLNDYLFI